MANYSMRTAVLISIIIGVILPYIGIGGIFNLIIMGFIATYLTAPEESSYKVGGIATGILGILLSLLSFFTPPELPYELPSPLTLGLGVALSGIIYLIVGIILSVAIFVAMGLIGGFIADKLFGKKEVQPKRVSKENRRLYSP
jgi:hypothetical protein